LKTLISATGSKEEKAVEIAMGKAQHNGKRTLWEITERNGKFE